jgi:hypothetical protein
LRLRLPRLLLCTESQSGTTPSSRKRTQKSS